MNAKKKVLVVFAIVIGGGAIISYVVMLSLFFSPREEEIREPIPQVITRSKTSPDKTRTAVLFFSNTGKSWDLLGAEERYYLGIQYEHATYIVARELTEGMGTYEGGVLDVQWLDHERILIERIISDR